MIAAGTRIDASVAGSFDYIKDPDALESFVRQALVQFGTVLTVNVDSSWFNENYTADVAFITTAAHASIEDIRGIVAGVFESWNGRRPAVTLPSFGDTPQRGQAPAGLPDNGSGFQWPDLQWPTIDTSTLVFGAVIVIAIVAAPLVWKAAK